MNSNIPRCSGFVLLVSDFPANAPNYVVDLALAKSPVQSLELFIHFFL